MPQDSDIAERLISHPDQRNQYQYGDRPIPEPLIQQLDASSVVTRNVYGALVLNVDHLMFVDIDRESALDSIRRVAERHVDCRPASYTARQEDSA